MKRFFRTLILLFAALAALAAERPDSLFAEIDSIVKELSEITGLKMIRPVPHEMMSRDQLRRFIENKIQEEVKPEEIRAEEAALKLFGFLPPDFNLERATIELLTEQAAAFYDYHRGRLYVINAHSDDMQQMALVHELAHALADEHFRLERFIKKVESADDASVARLAVMEGQASWITFEYMARKMGRSLKNSPDLLKSMATMMHAASGQYPVFDRAPLYLRESLLFPYTAGMLFQQSVIEKVGQAGFTEVFKRPPSSSQQILHPEKYFAREEPTQPRLPRLPPASGAKKLIEGSFGELDHSILLRQYCGQDAAALAANWRGSRFVVLESRDGRKTLAYVSEWRDPEAARAFFDQYKTVLEKKWKRCEWERQTRELLTGAGDTGRIEVRVSGAPVTSLEGLP